MALKNASRKLLWIIIYVWTHLGSCSTGVSSAGLVRAFNNKWDNSEACFMQSPRGPQQDWAPDGHNSYCSSMPVYWLLPLPVSIFPPAHLLPGITSQTTCSPSRQPHVVLFLNPEPQACSHLDLIVRLLSSLPCWNIPKKPEGPFPPVLGREISSPVLPQPLFMLSHLPRMPFLST